MDCAESAAVPAGQALAVDRSVFSREVTRRIASHPKIDLVQQEVVTIPDGPTIIASGPLTSDRLANAITALTGEQQLYFYDAIAPIVASDSIDMQIAFRASRYARGTEEEGDYINCPFERGQYESFVDALLSAERIPLRSFETKIAEGVDAGPGNFFEGCLPVEIICRRGRDALAFGPMRPVGLVDPRTGRRPYANIQLRQDNLAGSLYNMVGFQTNLTYPEQKRVFRLAPGLEKAEFVRYGQMHRNTFLCSPHTLLPTLQYKRRADLFFAGQITGVEGYMGNIATGLLAGWNVTRLLQGKPLVILPPTTMLGALCTYITNTEPASFQPMKANFGILPPLPSPPQLGKRERAKAYADRSLTDLDKFSLGL